MPVNAVKPGQEKHWDRAKKLAAERGHPEDYGYIMGIFKRLTDIKKSVSSPAFKQHTVSGKKIPSPTDNIDGVDTEMLGQQLADRLSTWIQLYF